MTAVGADPVVRAVLSVVFLPGEIVRLAVREVASKVAVETADLEMVESLEEVQLKSIRMFTPSS